MTTETILTPAQVDSLLDGVLRASGSRLGNYTYQKTLDDLRSSIRAIEQAVLQSPQMQAQQEDSDRYHALRQMNWFDSPLCVVVNPQKYLKLGAFCPSVGELDAAIDDAIRSSKNDPHKNARPTTRRRHVLTRTNASVR